MGNVFDPLFGEKEGKGRRLASGRAARNWKGR
jgi:hypothetical protein